jgi:ribosomal protein S27E
MSAEELAAVLDKWGKPDPSLVGKLPRVTCKDCSDRQRTCQKHTKAKCDVCGAFVSTAHIHLDYMGHAEVTRALIEIDPGWSWEPVAWSEQGEPLVQVRQNTARLWGRLTLLGVSRIGVGSCQASKDDVEKELVGDFLRNAAMRFGVGLSLWSKSEWDDHHDDTPVPEPPVPMADREVVDHLTAGLASLTDEQMDRYQEWRKANGVPSLKRPITEAQADAVAGWLDELHAGRPFEDES